MFHDFKIEEGDYGTNSLTATMITQLTEAEEKKWRGMLAEAWDEGWRDCAQVGPEDAVIGDNPYRDSE